MFASSVTIFELLKPRDLNSRLDLHDGASKMPPTMMVSPLLVVVLCVISILVHAQEEDDNDAQSSFSRGMAAQGSKMTFPDDPRVPRATFPQDNPHICLAFLSCCDRIDLLNHTIAAAIRHMEQDEPQGLRYEIAWVDNGSDSEMTQSIKDSYQIEHALTLPQNAGLAYGMNLLIFNLCKAPYILLLEEDWMYLDELVATQTPERKRAIATAIALAQQGNLTSFDGRPVLGVFLRPETYNHFLKPPFVHDWAQTQVDLSGVAADAPECDASETECSAADQLSSSTTVDYQIFCADTSFSTGYVWGSYTNGAGLYSRAALMNDIGRMFGEPGDTFHDRYVEVNYSYRVGLKYCHAAIRVSDCREVALPECAAAFYHIGGGRGTRPRTAEGSKCIDDGWAFYGTDLYQRYLRAKGITTQSICSKEDFQAMRDARTKEADTAEYREAVRLENQRVFEMEQKKREEMQTQARLLKTMDKEILRNHVDWLVGKTDEEIDALADKMKAFAASPHPLKGFWDSHGRPLV